MADAIALDGLERNYGERVVLSGMELDGLEKAPEALEELRRKGLAG